MFSFFCRCDCRTVREEIDEIREKYALAREQMLILDGSIGKVRGLLTELTAVIPQELEKAKAEMAQSKPKAKKQ